uniref:Uncharacterized protein n=1 Tax=Romanomermis culicivorax TaxID=13658 RepID=A0A915JCN9_ROMCU
MTCLERSLKNRIQNNNDRNHVALVSSGIELNLEYTSGLPVQAQRIKAFTLTAIHNRRSHGRSTRQEKYEPFHRNNEE